MEIREGFYQSNGFKWWLDTPPPGGCLIEAINDNTMQSRVVVPCMVSPREQPVTYWRLTGIAREMAGQGVLFPCN